MRLGLDEEERGRVALIIREKGKSSRATSQSASFMPLSSLPYYHKHFLLLLQNEKKHENNRKNIKDEVDILPERFNGQNWRCNAQESQQCLRRLY